MVWYRDEKTGQQKKLTKGNQITPKHLTHLYASKGSTERAVKQAWRRIQCGEQA
jgi:hypothetical protein